MDTVIQIACPKCHKNLRIRGRDKLGKKGKCPACGHSFLLQEPPEAEVAFELVEAAPLVGTSAKWVPDDEDAPVATDVAPAAQPASDMPAPGVAAAPVIAIQEPVGAARIHELRRRNVRRTRSGLLIGGIVLLAVAGGAFALLPSLRNTPAPVADEPARPMDGPVAAASDPAAPVAGDALWLREQMRENSEFVKAFRPTQGNPIALKMIPSGVNLVFHLHPARLWGDEIQYQELRASLTEGVVSALEAKIREICHREPQQIEETLIVGMLGAGGTPPQWACVVHLKEEAKLSDLIVEFRGRALSDEGAGPRITVGDKEAYLVRDTKTFAICPAGMASELKDWYDEANTYASPGVTELLPATDSDRLFTVLFEVDDIRLHEDALFPETGRAAFRRFIDWFGDDVQTVCWSLELQEQLHSELRLRARTTGRKAVTTPDRLAADIQSRLEELPRDMVAVVQRMSPQQRGFAEIISRFPAMLEAFRQSTVPSVDANQLILTTLLPAKAAPNLALGTLLTWDESTRTDFSVAAPVLAAAPQPGSALPATVVERLKLPVDAEFSRTPLQEAFKYIGGELQVSIDINGDALKSSGYTQNMPQTFNLGRVPALAAIHEIIKQYDGKGKEDDRMVIAIDEERKAILVLTKKFATDLGITPYPTTEP